MKRKILYFLSAGIFFCASWGTLSAQSQEQIEKFKEEQRKYYTERLELTEAESKAFWPIYDDFLNRKMKLVEDERNTWKYAHKNAENFSDEEILEATVVAAFFNSMDRLADALGVVLDKLPGS